MEWSNETIEEFLIAYEKEPCLWNPKSTDHKNRNNQHDAWTRIQKKLSDGTISINNIKKKRDNLMATYRKLRSKISQSTKSGSGADDIFKPDWPFYNVMSTFLDDVYYPRQTKNSAVTEDKEEIEDLSESNDSKNEDTKSDDEVESQFKRPKILPKRTKKNDTEKKMDEAYDYLKQMTQKLRTPQDECSLYTQLLCKKLRALQENTREIAMLEIDRLIFNLKQRELLTSNSQAQVQTVSPQPLNFRHSHDNHFRYSLQQIPSYNATPPQQSPRYHPFNSSGQSSSNNSSPSPHPPPNYHSSPSAQPSLNYHPFPSPQSSSNYHPSPSPQPSPDYHPSPSPQPSPNYHSFPSPQPSPNYHPSPSPQPSPNYHPSPSPQPSPNYHSSPSPQPSPNYHPSPSPQPSLNYHSSPPQPSPNYHPSPSPQSSLNYHPYPSPQQSQDENLLATSNVLKNFYEQEGGNFA